MGTKTALFGRSTPGGIFTIESQDFTTGSHWFVHSGTGTDGAGYGTSPDSPVATIDYAIGLCTASKGDIIHVMPGHAESISSATGCVCDVAGITIRGVSRDRGKMPVITIDTATTALISVTAAGVTLENLWIEAGFADIAAAISVGATNCTIRNCHFMESTATKNMKIAVLGGAAATADNLIVENCYAYMYDAANTHFVSLPGTTANAVVRNNVIYGDFGTAAIGAAGVVINCAVLNNVIYNAASDNDSCINIANTGTGLVMNNLCCGAAAQANGITATTCAICQNYYGVISEDLSGILEPIAT